MMYLTVIPKPDVGAVFVRYRDNGEYEEASVASVITRGGEDSWVGTLVCNSGFDFLGGSPERRQFESWFPKGWIFDSVSQSFRPPNTRWDETANEYVVADLGEATDGRARPGDPKGEIAQARPLPGLDDIPAPQPGEHHMAWRGRTKRANPSADWNDPRVDTMLKLTWDNRRAPAGGETGGKSDPAATPTP